MLNECSVLEIRSDRLRADPRATSANVSLNDNRVQEDRRGRVADVGVKNLTEPTNFSIAEMREPVRLFLAAAQKRESFGR